MKVEAEKKQRKRQTVLLIKSWTTEPQSDFRKPTSNSHPFYMNVSGFV